MPRPRRTGALPAGGRAAGLAALAAGLTLGLMSGGASTLITHPGDAAAVLIPLAGALGLTIAAAFRSRAVAQRRGAPSTPRRSGHFIRPTRTFRQFLSVTVRAGAGRTA